MIPHSRPTISEEEVQAVAEVLRSGQLACGERVARFEEAFARFIGCRYAVAVSSGTAALHLSLLALGVRPGDEVAIPSYVCSALLNATAYVGARPVLIDIDPGTFNMDSMDLKKRVTELTKVVVLPHMFGLPGEIEGISHIGLPMIEDCAMAPGARYKRRRVGSVGTIGVFSFYATKMMTTGEGGMVTTNDRDIAETVRDLRGYDEKEDDRVRFNYKMTEIAATLGEIQLRKVDAWVEERRRIAAVYDREFAICDVTRPVRGERDEHAFYRYVVKVEGDIVRSIAAFEYRGITVRRPVFCPIHRLLGMGETMFPGGEEAFHTALSLPIYPTLRDEEQHRVIEAAVDIFET
ncbi:MAG: DegT/DnrJ/EryC1/StrS aminotransferase family protein [Candidatus Latescibacteria bacterium]|nr:DegT/DnrJ/EryC1/StrS aminotransferase family protein [Candidatus Latescibacterota bacterium]